MKIRLKGQYAKTQASEEASTSTSQANGRRSKQQQQKAEEQEEDEEQQDEEDEEEEDEQQEGSTSASSEADDDYLNAPINDLPESSGDEYFAPPSTSLKPRGRPLGSKNKRRATRDSESPDTRRPVRSIRASIGGATERPKMSSTRRSIATASPLVAAPNIVKRGRGRPPGSLNKKGRKGKARSESVHEEEDEDDDDDSALDVEDPDESAAMEEDEEAPSTIQSGTSTPSGRTVFGADGRKRTVASGAARMKAVKGLKYQLDNDELSLPVDPKGEEKVDKLGRLQGGREYKVFTFTSPSRPEPERLYVLAIDAARCAGFRDSLYFFRRNPWIHKINASQDEKEMLIELGRLHQNLRSRQVTIVTARNLYKVFGARFVKNGRYVTDDYYESASIAKGYKAGTPAFNEVYDPERDNTTLAMPKVGSFAKSKAEGRPAYMRMEKAFELLHRGMPIQDREDGTPEVDNYASHEERERERNKKRREEEGDSSEDETGIKKRKKKRPSAFTTLALPQTYRPQDFGLVTHPSYQSLVAGAQFGGNGQTPFGEQWERSKARKPAPFLNGFNWMYEFARFTSKETNRAIMGIRKEFNAYHRITLGLPETSLTPQQVDEEQEGIWDISDPEHEDEYETLDQFRYREGLDEAPVVGPDGEVDDRKRGRSVSPRLREGGEIQVKPEGEGADMETDDPEGKPGKTNGSTRHTRKRRRRRRSPLRGYYDGHTRTPQIKLDTQPAEVLKWEQTALEPKFAEDPKLAAEAARKGIASVEYLMPLTTQ